MKNVASLIGLSKCIESSAIKRSAIEKATKANFNLFTTLLNIGDENRLHSRFIASLLDPNGNHDCGSMFLSLFLNTICEDDIPIEFLKIKDSVFVSAKTEQQTNDNRRLDIYLEFSGYCIAIENKIWAIEQKEQLKDYAEFINSNSSNNLLLYLTLDGKDSCTSNGLQYYPISYKDHILSWISKCLKETYKYPNINHALQQYQVVVKKLTGQDTEGLEMKEIVEYISKNPDIIKYHREISNSINEVLRQTTSNFFKEWISLIKSDPEIKVINPDYHGNILDPLAVNRNSHIELSYNNFIFQICYVHKDSHHTNFVAFPDYKNMPPEQLSQVKHLQQKIPHNMKWDHYWGLAVEINSIPSFDDSEFLVELLEFDNVKKHALIAHDELKKILKTCNNSPITLQ